MEVKLKLCIYKYKHELLILKGRQEDLYLSINKKEINFMNKRICKKEKRKVEERYLCGETVDSICKYIGYPRSTIYDWIRKHKSGLQDYQVNLKDYKILKTIYERQKLVVHILQNAPCKASDPLRARLEAIKDLSSKYTVYTLCDAFNVPKGTYYNFILRRKGENSQAAKRTITP